MPENTPTAKDARSARRWCCCVLLAVLWCASLPLACLPGPVPVAVADVWQALGAVVGLCPPADGSVQLVVGQIRLARVLLGLLCGGALAVAGVALQGVLRNPLADPFTLGISAGAACGASMAIALGGSLGIWAGGLAVGLSAAATVSLAALLGMTLIYALGHTPLLRLFTDLPEVLAAAERYADWGICFPACAALGLTYYGLFTGSSLTRPVFLSTLQALVAFGLAWLAFVPFWGNHGLWGAYLIFYAGRSFFLLRYWPRLRDAPSFRHGGAALC